MLQQIKTKAILVLAFLLGVISVDMLAQQSVSEKKIGLPPNTVEGVLPNGLHYLILPNGTPAHTTEFRLVMRLGSAQETDKQKGAAHFLEHMSFAGSKHFPGRGMVDYLESLGMKFGRDINAVTGYDRTIFMLTVPMDKTDSAVSDKVLLILKDWLDGLSFEEERTKKERGVILEELRGYDIGDDFYSLKIGQNRFTDRMPLGSSEDIRSIDRKTLIEFYQQWYSPQMATVVVVGDVDPVSIEKKIKEMFASIPRKKVKGYRVYPLTYEKGIALHEIGDDLKRSSELELIIPHPCVVGNTVGTIYHKELGSLLVRAITNRLQARQIRSNVSDAWFLSDKNHFVFTFSGTDKSGLLQQVSDLSNELECILKNGFTPEELDDAIKELSRTLKVDCSAQLSGKWCDDFVDYVISGDRYIQSEKEMRQLLEKIRSTDSATLQKLLQEWLSYKEQALLVAYRNNTGKQNSIQKEDILRAWEKGIQSPLKEFVYVPKEVKEETITAPVCLTKSHMFDASDIVSEKKYPEMNLTEVFLKNGLRFLLRPTDDENQSLFVTAFGRGGVGDLSDEDYPLYEGTGGYMEMGGIACVPYDTLSSYMQQEEISMNLAISNFWHDIMGMAPADKAQELFNLMYEKIYRPELCYKDFDEIRQDEIERLGKETVLEQMMKRASDRALTNRLDSLMGNIVSRPALTKKDLESLNLDKIAAYYRSLYANPSQTVFVVTGKFDTDSIKKLLTGTFARMEKVETGLSFSDKPFKLPGKTYVEAFPNENDTQTIFDYVFCGNYQPSLRNSLTLKLMRDILQNRVLSILRERENIVYSPYASLFYNGLPQQVFYFDLSASVDWGNTKKVEGLIKEIIHELRTHKVSEEELDAMKKSFLLTKQKVLSNEASAEWRTNLVNLLKNGETIDDFEQYEKCLSSISTTDIRKAFKELVNPDKFVLLYIGKHQKYNE